jgi:hypothetical protein
MPLCHLNINVGVILELFRNNNNKRWLVKDVFISRCFDVTDFNNYLVIK